jgi:hypothetical protein
MMWPHPAQNTFLRACENPNGNIQGSKRVCACLLRGFERFPALPDMALGVTWLTDPPVPYWYRNNTGRCGVG